MSQNSTATLTQSWQQAVVHLRLSFALVLTPLFVLGIYLAPPVPIDWLRVAAAYLIIHILVNGGLNAFNSYYDRDEGPIGGLEEPPPVDQNVLYIGIAFKVLALITSFWFSIEFGFLTMSALLASVAYSHERWRWKERPWHALIIIFVGQGLFGVLWGWLAATQNGTSQTTLELIGQLDAVAIAGILGGAFWTASFYPLTGVYQIPEDSQRGITTLAVRLGVEHSFHFAALVGLPSLLCTGFVLLQRGEYIGIVFGLLYMGLAGHEVWRWRQRFGVCTSRENQRTLMKIAYANGLFFTLFFGLLLVKRLIML